jgi:N-methylhydantoinase A
MKRVIVPRNPGILCAMGLLLTDLRADFSTTRLVPLEEANLPSIVEAATQVEHDASTWFESEAITADRRRMTRRIDMRYDGQNYELSIAIPEGPITSETLNRLRDGFTEAHRQMYGFAVEGERILCVTFRAEALGVVQKADLPRRDAGPSDATGAIVGQRDVWFPETRSFTETAILSRDLLASGMIFSGPAIIEQMDTTTLVPPGTKVWVDEIENLILELPE